MNLSQFLKTELALENISLSQLNTKKYNSLRQNLVARMLEQTVFNGYKSEKSLKTVRDTGIKFSNEYGRETFRKLTGYKNKSKYAGKLSGNVLPNINKLPEMLNAPVKDAYFYGFTILLHCKDNIDKKGKKKKDKKIPHNFSTANFSKHSYNNKSSIALWSDTLLTKNEVTILALSQFSKDIDLRGIENLTGSYVDGSDWNNLTRSTDCELVAIKLDRVLKT